MQNFEFMGYKPTPTDQYMIGIATIRVLGKIVLRFKHVKTKDGNGSFFCCANYTLTENGEKKYVPCFILDSRAEDEMLQDYIRECVNKATRVTSVHVHQAAEPLNNYGQAKSGVAAEEQGLPF